MQPVKIIAAVLMGLALSACGAPEYTTRNATMVLPPQTVPAALDVQSVSVTVPQSLTVSEANRYFPGGDIVWREDPIGDRHAQVQTIVEDAMTRGVRGLDTGTPVALDIEVLRFHALTQKARYTTGGVHDIKLRMTLRDAQTGAPLSEPRLIAADLKAYGGARALEAEKRGETQKVRITAHLADVIRTELVSPGTRESAKLGVMTLFSQRGG